MCPDWESNQRPFGSQASTQSTEAHQPGMHQFLFKLYLVREHIYHDMNLLNLLRELFYSTAYGLSWLMFLVDLKKMSIVWLLDGVVYKFQVGQVG